MNEPTPSAIVRLNDIFYWVLADQEAIEEGQAKRQKKEETERIRQRIQQKYGIVPMQRVRQMGKDRPSPLRTPQIHQAKALKIKRPQKVQEVPSKGETLSYGPKNRNT